MLIDNRHRLLLDSTGRIKEFKFKGENGKTIKTLFEHKSNGTDTKDLNVKKVITIAGNLDHRAWTEYHHLPPLIQSLNLADYKETFALIPQVHYIGENDKVIPPILTEKFVEDKKSILIVPNATHGDGWNNILIDL